jgi:putative aldouronate transport system substrate-binding protein
MSVRPGDVHGLVAGGQVGFWMGSPFNARWGPDEAIVNDPGAKFTFTDIPMGPTGRKGRGMTNPYVDGVNVFRKGFEHVDAVIQQGNFMAELLEDPQRRMHGWEGYQYNWEGDELVDGEGTFKGWCGFVGTSGGGGVDPDRRYRYHLVVDEWAKLPESELDAWQLREVKDPTGIAQYYRDVYNFAVENTQGPNGILNRFTRLPTETMKEQQTAIDTLRDETKLGIITGDLPVDAWDDFIDQYMNLGGAKIIDEVNEWWQSR